MVCGWVMDDMIYNFNNFFPRLFCGNTYNACFALTNYRLVPKMYSQQFL